MGGRERGWKHMSQTMRHVLGRSHGDFDGRRAVGGSPGNAHLALMSMARAGSLPEPPPRPQQSSPTGRVRGRCRAAGQRCVAGKPLAGGAQRDCSGGAAGPPLAPTAATRCARPPRLRGRDSSSRDQDLIYWTGFFSPRFPPGRRGGRVGRMQSFSPLLCDVLSWPGV